MKFCQRHWDLMRAAVEARGMTPLVAANGKSAAENLVSELQDGQTLDNFDPLMAMHWNIAGNAMEKLGPNALYLMGGGPEDPIDMDRLTAPELKTKYAGQTWPRCPLCYMNIAHEFTCVEASCRLARVDGYDVAIEWAADGVKQKFDELMSHRKP